MNQSIPNSVIELQLTRSLFALLQAHDYAAELGRDRWDFAVEIATLREMGTTNSDLRWLVCKKYVEHAFDITPLEKDEREFQAVGILNFGDRTCFVLTEAGLQFARHRLRNTSCDTAGHAENVRTSGARSLEDRENRVAGGTRQKAVDNNGKQADRPRIPKWDSSRHELRLGHALVKVFKLPSRNQEAVLVAFEEESWPPRIDDPLPPQGDVDPKRRLHDTIKSLNGHQKNSLVRFMGDGTGEGIRWELCRGASGGTNGRRE